MIPIPPSDFKMGEEEHAHSIETKGFEIAKYPITNRIYKKFVESGGENAPIHWVNGEIPITLEDHPVVNVSWHDAINYCAWLSEKAGVHYRLPTEAEWELTARGSNCTTYPWGDSFFAENCNCWEVGVGWTTPVNCFANGASDFGVLDMVGNVWEWCSSLYQDYPYDAQDGRENLKFDDWRTLRGGSWLDHEWGVRAARRLSGDPNRPSHNTGFRIIKEL